MRAARYRRDSRSSRYSQSGNYLAEGDFNGDGIVNALDFNALASNYGQTLGTFTAIPSPVPEPGLTTVLLSLAFAASHRRKRSRGGKSA